MVSLIWAVLLLLVLTNNATSFECPDLKSCDCKRKHDWKQDGDAYYNVVTCVAVKGEMDLNLTSLRNITLRKITLKKVAYLRPDMLKDVLTDTIVIDGGTVKLTGDVFKEVKSTLKHLTLRNLTQLSLTNTSEKYFRLDFLRGFDQLETLRLDWNGYFPFHFPGKVFKDLGLTSLKSLKLRHCNMAKMADDSFDGLINLQTLDLSYNRLPNVPDAILRLRNLRKITLSHNPSLSYIHHEAFRTLSKLTEIKMSHTVLETILSGAFDGLEHSLERLDLSHGALQHGHFESLKNLTKLTYLDFSYNRIVEMHNTSFDGFQSLEELDISRQFAVIDDMAFRLSFVDSLFRGLETKLKILRIRDLGLVSLPLASLSPLKNLQILDASKNDFTDIYESFFDGIHAKTIYLTDMEISTVYNSAFDDIGAGVSFVFDRNNITNISFILNTKTCNFQKFSFLENPVVCDCDVMHIMTSGRVQDLEGVCTNDEFKGQPFSRLNKLATANGKCDADSSRISGKCSSVNSASANGSVLTGVRYFVCMMILMLTCLD